MCYDIPDTQRKNRPKFDRRAFPDGKTDKAMDPSFFISIVLQYWQPFVALLGIAWKGALVASGTYVIAFITKLAGLHAEALHKKAGVLPLGAKTVSKTQEPKEQLSVAGHDKTVSLTPVPNASRKRNRSPRELKPFAKNAAKRASRNGRKKMANGK